MVTTMTIAIAGQNVRICFKGDFKNVAFNRDLRLHVGKIICDKIKERKLGWAHQGVFYLQGVSNAYGLTGRIEPAGPGHDSYETLPIKLSYDNLFEEESAPNIIRDWR